MMGADDCSSTTVSTSAPERASSPVLGMASRKKIRKAHCAEQEATAASIFAGQSTAAAYHIKLSSCVVSELDHTYDQSRLRAFSSKAYERDQPGLGEGHLSLISHPREEA